MKDIILSVAEAKHRDAGRSIARLHPKNMEKLSLVSGDIIELKGRETTSAIIWLDYPEESDISAIKVDGDTRGNAGVGIGEKVTIRKIKANQAKKIVIAPNQAVRIIKGSQYLSKILKGRPIIEKQKIRVEILGNPITFTIISTNPAGTVLITDTISIVLKEKPLGEETRTEITYEDIGGLRKEIATIREMIELPLRHPELFQEIGIEPPKGILLYGHSGTGKTLLAKAVANESEASFFSIKGPDVITKYYGDSEARLREIFEQAEKEAPSIIFIDEIDSIAPKRGSITGDSGTSERIISQLLTEIDGIEDLKDVLVLAATNRKDMIDDALLRPGRFDRIITIGLPDEKSRQEIFNIHCKGKPLADVNLAKLAKKTEGYSGADIAALCMIASNLGIREFIKTTRDVKKDFKKFKIFNKHFEAAFSVLEKEKIKSVADDKKILDMLMDGDMKKTGELLEAEVAGDLVREEYAKESL